MDNTSRKLDCFNLASELTELRNSAAYQQMRVEINRRNNPLSGGTDWEKVYQLALQISSGLGADLLTSAYFVTAASKTRGVSGLASGLDLMLSVVSFSTELAQLPNEKVSEIINWAVTKVTPEIKKMAVTSSNVRDWYRCEHACQKLFELITQKQPQQVPNLDVLGYLIFEKIDLLETNKVSVLPSSASNTVPVKVKARRWPLWALSSLIVICSLLSGYLAVLYHQEVSGKLPLWLYQAPEEKVAPESSIAQRIDRAFSLPQGEPLVSIYPEQVSLLVELDKNYQRFANARTIMANLSQLSQALPESSNKMKQETLSIAQYASSLSPILGRTYYIGDLLEDKEYARAEVELNQLNSQLKALLIKRTLLAQQLHNQQSDESGTPPLELSSQPSSDVISQDGER
ncbi:type VI secretion system ImpA family N-terminal domain-containing protein [Shewanella woodyi]|uniref:type VI secretion system ImpA family N-terminal domain-containing protein n=1 Tax=Shewanella woodyi TaxID=60961 RepID=UPI0007EA40B5|nr:type VI secretion system ImpA family N-terminal domain-containing protein [Shewanella woodyi]